MPDRAQIIADVLELARSQVGIRESPSNWGPMVQKFLAATGINFPAPWCAAYTYWVLETVAERHGVETPMVRSAYCPTIYAWAETQEILHRNPERGDCFLLISGRARHIGFVSAVSKRAFSTIEGNTSLSGSPEGIGVFERTRSRASGYRFVRWADLLQTTAPPWTLFLSGRKMSWTLPHLGGRALAPVRPWGEALGLEVGWDQDRQAVLLGGKEVDTEVTLILDSSYAPVRDLARHSGLLLEVDGPARAILVKRP